MCCALPAAWVHLVPSHLLSHPVSWPPWAPAWKLISTRFVMLLSWLREHGLTKPTEVSASLPDLLLRDTHQGR